MTKNDFALAFNEILEEKQLAKDVIVTAIESAMVSAYRRAVNASTAQHVEAKLDHLGGEGSAGSGRIVSPFGLLASAISSSTQPRLMWGLRLP